MEAPIQKIVSWLRNHRKDILVHTLVMVSTEIAIRVIETLLSH